MRKGIIRIISKTLPASYFANKSFLTNPKVLEYSLSLNHLVNLISVSGIGLQFFPKPFNCRPMANNSITLALGKTYIDNHLADYPG